MRGSCLSRCKRMKIIIGGVISLPPYSPGTAWHWLQYALGFQKLGHEVFFIEEVRPEWCVDAHGHPCSFRDSVNRDLFRATVEPFGLAEGLARFTTMERQPPVSLVIRCWRSLKRLTCSSICPGTLQPTSFLRMSSGECT